MAEFSPESRIAMRRVVEAAVATHGDMLVKHQRLDDLEPDDLLLVAKFLFARNLDREIAEKRETT